MDKILNNGTKELIEEARAIHRHVKKELLHLIDIVDDEKLSKNEIRDLLFKLYVEIK